MHNEETPFCESAQRTKSYVTGERKDVDKGAINNIYLIERNIEMKNKEKSLEWQP